VDSRSGSGWFRTAHSEGGRVKALCPSGDGGVLVRFSMPWFSLGSLPKSAPRYDGFSGSLGQVSTRLDATASAEAFDAR